MKAYVICIIVVSVINIINEINYKSKNYKITLLNYILFIFSLFVICFIAGIRDITVGTDITVYVTRLINVSNNSSGIIDFIFKSNSDLLFALLVYITNLFKNINITLFFIELAVALPIYIYSFLEKEKKSFTINILIFLLTMYCISLNLMRQSIAISICILSYHFFDNKKYKKSIILLIMAFMFHKTALIFIIILFINYIIKSKIKNKIIIISMIILLGLFATIFMDKIVSITSYSEYLNQSNLMRDFSVGSILKKLFWVALGGFCILSINKQSKIDNKNFIIALIISIISLMLTITSFKIPGTGRLGYYFNDISYFLIIYEISNTFKQRKFVLIVLITLLFGLWWNMTAVKNDSSNVYPYKTSIIKFLN